jgi:hypothetical protein
MNGPMLVRAIHRTIGSNYARGGGSANKDRSRENWLARPSNTDFQK